ncbi:hypothetical protein BURKHO8Y_60215 [Burkholderia sp. 8Y]|nr:hypothetical protein BURKHO8Y_60215 [Burkholderia sp. 8Y]
MPEGSQPDEGHRQDQGNAGAAGGLSSRAPRRGRAPSFLAAHRGLRLTTAKLSAMDPVAGLSSTSLPTAP